MNKRVPNQDAVRVFLCADTPELILHLNLLHDAIAEVEAPSLEPHLIEPENVSSTSGSKPGREMREGDVLIPLIFEDSGSSTTFEAIKERAHHRRLILLPFRATRQTQTPSGLKATDLLSSGLRFHPFDPSADPSVTVRAIVFTLIENLALVSPLTDLNGEWLPVETKGTKGATRKSAIQLLRDEPSRSKGELGAAAFDSRQQAANAIEARLFEPALEALSRAAEYDESSALTAYWRARLLLVSGKIDLIKKAQLEADRACSLAHQEENLSPLEIAAWWLKGRMGALTGERATLLKALHEIGASPSSPSSILMPTLRFLTQCGLTEETLQWLRQACIHDAEILDRAIADPLLVPLLPLIQTLHGDQRAYLLKILRPLLESEKQLFEKWTKVSRTHLEAHAETAETEWEAIPIHALKNAVQAAILRQIGLFNDWAESLVKDAQKVRQARIDRIQLVDADEAIPDPTRFDHMLERVWPRLSEKRDDLAAAIRETEREINRLQTLELEVERSLSSRLQDFIDCSLRFEEIVVQAPEQLTEINTNAFPKGETLRVADGETLRAEGIACDEVCLPETLAALVNSMPKGNAGPHLYRMEPNRNSGPIASRAGVYFHQAFSRSTRGRSK